jgi:spore coat polysaccharide biosynthesis protein SpsF (cytidylyltransferase family)
VLATTTQPEDAAIVDVAAELGVTCFRGEVNDVLDRFYRALIGRSADLVVRLTADCPLIDPALIDEIVNFMMHESLDYCSNTLSPQFPDGQDVEIFRFAALERAWREARLPSEREHVTPYIWKNSSFVGGTLFSSKNFNTPKSFSHLRMTIDEEQDLKMMRKLIAAVGVDKPWIQYADWLEGHPEVRRINESIARNEGYKNSTSKD